MGDMGPPPSYNSPPSSTRKLINLNPVANPHTYRQPHHSPSPSLHNTSHLYTPPQTPDLKDRYYSTPQQYAARKHGRRKICCIALLVIVVLMALTIGLTVAGAVFHWGNSRYCVRWNDGTTSGDCDPHKLKIRDVVRSMPGGKIWGAV